MLADETGIKLKQNSSPLKIYFKEMLSTIIINFHHADLGTGGLC